MIVAFAGKGGVGKTSLCAILLDELLWRGYDGSVLVVDADPAMTLHLTLGLPEPVATVADVRETTPLDAQTIHTQLKGISPAQYVAQRLREAGVLATYSLRGKPLHYLAMGQGEGVGCYCSVNRALSIVLGQMVNSYQLVLVDNEAGLEHLSRYRLDRVDLFVLVATPSSSAQAVAQRVLHTARQVNLSLGETWTVFNQASQTFHPPTQVDSLTMIVPAHRLLPNLERRGWPITELTINDPVRVALRPLVERILCV